MSELTPAEQDLQRAIEAVAHEEGWLPDGAVLGDWLIATEVIVLDDPDGKTLYGHILPNVMPWHRILGLMEVTKRRLDTGLS